MFKIIKKGANNFWHYYNNDAKKLYVSKITFNLEEVANTFVLVQANGSNVPANKVLVTDIIVIDETDASVEETFATAEELRVRLNELGYGVVSSGGGGAVDSVNGQTGIVELDADDIDETSTRKYVSSSEKTAITHSNRSILDAITESFTTALKTAYDGAKTNIDALLLTGSRLITTGEIAKLSNTSGTNSGDNATNTTSNAYADAKVAENIKTLTLASPATTTSTTAVTTNLSTPIAIGETLKFNLDLIVSTSTNGIKIQINVPAGGVLKGGLITANTLSTSARVLGMVENTLTLAVATTAATAVPIQIGFTIDSTTASGNVVLAFASGSGGSTTIDKGSSMQIFKPTLV
jgi:hypothetical protein